MPCSFFARVAILLLLAISLGHAAGWGYGYDSLRADLALWAGNANARVDSFGASARGRALWMVTVSDSTDSLDGVEGRNGPKRRVMVHARTHPWEVQAFHVGREMLRFLLDSTEVSRSLRRDYIFHFVPQYNPDGVEMELERTNANGVDLESNWDNASPQPEVLALKGLFQSFMVGPIPVDVALNLHSDQYNGKRFFVYHVEAGTSWVYTEQEKTFIAGVQSHFPGGIQNWDFLTSWASGAATRYPEGFWWTNYKENVLALTYEDDNSSTAGKFDSTARALVLGIADFLRQDVAAVRATSAPSVRLSLVRQGVCVRVPSAADWDLFDAGGRRLGGGHVPTGETILSWRDLASGKIGILVVRFPGSTERLLLPATAR